MKSIIMEVTIPLIYKKQEDVDKLLAEGYKANQTENKANYLIK